jgi:WbqC-like protein family
MQANSLSQSGPGATKTVAIVQSSYVPWKGYFDLMNAVDEFILLDEVQYTRRDWRNRNRLKSPSGIRWLTIPVMVKGRYLQRIDETFVSDPSWTVKHWSSLLAWYRRAPCFERYRSLFEHLYLDMSERRLSEINRRFLETLRDLLSIATPITSSCDYPAGAEKTERLLSICHAAGAGRYVSGPAARAYLDEERFRAEHVEVVWMSYEDYPEYEQMYPPFDHHVSVLDLLFSVGDDAPRYMLGAHER